MAANANFAGACARRPSPPALFAASSRVRRTHLPPSPAACAEIGTAFSQHYYNTFDSNRAGLQALYQDGSMLTFENEQFMGMQNIMQKLTVRRPATRPRPPPCTRERPEASCVQAAAAAVRQHLCCSSGCRFRRFRRPATRPTLTRRPPRLNTSPPPLSLRARVRACVCVCLRRRRRRRSNSRPSCTRSRRATRSRRRRAVSS